MFKASQGGCDPREANPKIKLLLHSALTETQEEIMRLDFQFLLNAKPDLLVKSWIGLGEQRCSSLTG